MGGGFGHHEMVRNDQAFAWLQVATGGYQMGLAVGRFVSGTWLEMRGGLRISGDAMPGAVLMAVVLVTD